MRPSSGDGAESVRRRARVVSAAPGRLDVRWMESQCRGCVGCGGRCGLFAADDAGIASLRPAPTGEWPVGQIVDVAVPAARLRRAATRAYGVAIVALVAGAALGHAVGAAWAASNLGALVGLVSGTFLAGLLTKRLDASPPLSVLACGDLPLETDIDPKESPR